MNIENSKFYFLKEEATEFLYLLIFFDFMLFSFYNIYIYCFHSVKRPTFSYSVF